MNYIVIVIYAPHNWTGCGGGHRLITERLCEAIAEQRRERAKGNVARIEESPDWKPAPYPRRPRDMRPITGTVIVGDTLRDWGLRRRK